MFLPVVFALHYGYGGRRWQNAVVVVASYVFYGWWDYRFCALLLSSSLLDYVTGSYLGSARSPGRRRLLLGISLAGNLGVLGFFKYFGFFADSVAVGFAALGWDVSTTTLNIVLPVGISFYTFQTLSYTIDIYRGELEPKQDLLDYLAFVAFFPQLVAGPIERAKHLLPQFAQPRRFSHADAVEGCRLILWGLAKKMVLADNLGRLVDEVFAHAGTASGAELVLATICFGFQIYGDFSGYSDIASGTARMFGVQLQRNFNLPFFSRNLTEFWRRWHVSLSTWFRDYIYRPLGGSRCDAFITTRNILVTFLLSGLWHGAAWHFVAWGGVHGLCLVVSRWFAGRNHRLSPASAFSIKLDSTAGALASMSLTFVVVSLAWVLFRAESLDAAIGIYLAIARDVFRWEFYLDLVRLLAQNAWLFCVLAAFVGIEWHGRTEVNPLRLGRWPKLARWAAYTAWFWIILGWGTQRTSDFIYFQF